ncbi:DUF2169 family type VI secretion system accessory protein [Chondromyces apiculatus]|uniref:DUF2169 domain-containing protein n=1 Tax=Chondromyces apiculatus DSM 436 TaxID=1192034 RepID=A0A017T5T1_9BACT|nr:DUF2169 domain-containing protein [Chondromyces apiculatus]EYF04387.1 Hypothetical protein CAP_4526 [Chondromyces apiculatus DSM 436]
MEVVSSCPLPAASLVWQPRPSAWALTFLCKATFVLQAGEAQLAQDQEPLHADDSYWDDDPTRSLYTPSDLVPHKLRTDVVLVGSAFAPQGQPVRSLMVRLIVGEVDKAMEVLLDRAIAADGTLLEGQRFARMSLAYERAAGGPDSPNPVGVWPEGRDAYGRIKLPNLQPPGYMGAASEIAPVGFGPISPGWPGRREKLGRHLGSWPARAIAVGPLPEDVDRTFFNVAPRDQQVTGLTEDARLVLENLHPHVPRLVTSLPGLRPRAVLEGRGGHHALALHLDTLWIDTDRQICTLTWGGQLALERPDEPGRVSFLLDGVAAPPGDLRGTLLAGGSAGGSGGAGGGGSAGGGGNAGGAGGAGSAGGGGAGGMGVNGVGVKTPPPPPPPRPVAHTLVPDLDVDDDDEAPETLDGARQPMGLPFGGGDRSRELKSALPFAAASNAPGRDEERRVASDAALPFLPASTPAAGASGIWQAPVTPAVPPPRPSSPSSPGWKAPSNRPPEPPKQAVSPLKQATLPLTPVQQALSPLQQPTMPLQPAPQPPPTSGLPGSGPGIPSAMPGSGAGMPSSMSGAMSGAMPGSMPGSMPAMMPSRPPSVQAPSQAPMPSSPGTPMPPPPVPAPVPSPADSMWASGIGRGDQPPGRSIGEAAVAAATPQPAVRPEANGWTYAASSTAAAAGAVGLAAGKPREERQTLGAMQGAAAVRPAARMDAREILHLIWYAPESVARICRVPVWRAILDEMEQEASDKALDDPAPTKDPVEVEDRRDIFEILAHGASQDVDQLGDELQAAVRSGGKFVPSLLLVAGDLSFPFDEREMLKAAIAVGSTLAGADEGFKGTVREAREFLASPDLLCPPQLFEGHTGRIREAFQRTRRGLSADYLDVQVERALLEGRHYQRRQVLGMVAIRGYLLSASSGGARPAPVYLPEDLARKLPLFQRFRTRLLVELYQQEDQYEQHPAALKALALGRVTLAAEPRGVR